MERKDDRTPEDFVAGTHAWLVVATDSFLSGWGKAANGKSVCAWACSQTQLPDMERWVRSRDDMKRVRIVLDRDGKYRPRGNVAHFHVYRTEPTHRAFEGSK